MASLSLTPEHQDTQIAEVTHTVGKAFKDYNVSINAAPEVIEEEFGDPKIGPLAVSGSVSLSVLIERRCLILGSVMLSVLSADA